MLHFQCRYAGSIPAECIQFGSSAKRTWWRVRTHFPLEGSKQQQIIAIIIIGSCYLTGVVQLVERRPFI